MVVCEGGYPGRAAIWDSDEPIYFQKALHRVRFHEPAYAKWFVYYLHMMDLDGTLQAHFDGAGIQHFTGEALARFELPVPPLDELQQVMAHLDAALAERERLQKLYERKLAALDELKRSLLHHAFTGQLTERAAAALRA